LSRLLKNKEILITQKYKEGIHKGIDLVGYGHTLDYIINHSKGVVVALENNYNKTDQSGSSYGNYIKIKHDNGMYTLYAHLKYKSINYKVGDIVEKGSIIGYMGNTGHSKGAHLHFEIRNSTDTRIDPSTYLDNDLPNFETTIYQVYDNTKKKWLNKITAGSGNGILSYAGNFGNSISGLKINNKEYRVHDKIKNKWLNYIIGNTGSGILSYAGNLGNPIDGVQIKNATYRVHLKNGNWLSWITKVDDTNKGYAGVYGKEIDAIQIK